jgi:hypothetical protein
VGSKTFDGVRFAAYTDDHPPPHVHGFYAGVVVVMELIFAKKVFDWRNARTASSLLRPNVPT